MKLFNKLYFVVFAVSVSISLQSDFIMENQVKSVVNNEGWKIISLASGKISSRNKIKIQNGDKLITRTVIDSKNGIKSSYTFYTYNKIAQSIEIEPVQLLIHSAAIYEYKGNVFCYDYSYSYMNDTDKNKDRIASMKPGIHGFVTGYVGASLGIRICDQNANGVYETLFHTGTLHFDDSFIPALPDAYR